MPETHTEVEGENLAPRLSSDLHMPVMAHVFTHITTKKSIVLKDIMKVAGEWVELRGKSREVSKT